MRTRTSRWSSTGLMAASLLCLLTCGCKSGFQMPSNMFAWGKKNPSREAIARRPSASQLPNPRTTTTGQQLAGANTRGMPTRGATGTQYGTAATGTQYGAGTAGAAGTQYASNPYGSAQYGRTAQLASGPNIQMPASPTSYPSTATPDFSAATPSRSPYGTQSPSTPYAASPRGPYGGAGQQATGPAAPTAGDAYTRSSPTQPAGPGAGYPSSQPYAESPVGYEQQTPSAPYNGGASNNWQSRPEQASPAGGTAPLDSQGFRAPQTSYRPGSTDRDTGALDISTQSQGSSPYAPTGPSGYQGGGYGGSTPR